MGKTINCISCLLTLVIFFLLPQTATAERANTSGDAIGKEYVIEKASKLQWPRMTPRQFVDLLIMGKKIALVDVRSKMETAVWYPKSDNAMDTYIIPLQEIPEKLGHIVHPEKYDYVVLTCPTGPRAAAAAVLARLIGYDNVWFFRGGNKKLGSLTGTAFRKAAERLLREGKIKDVPSWMK